MTISYVHSLQCIYTIKLSLLPQLLSPVSINSNIVSQYMYSDVHNYILSCRIDIHV